MELTDLKNCDAAVARARAAFPAWSRTPAAARGSALNTAADALAYAADDLAECNERETGKTHDDAVGGVQAAVGTLRQYAQLGPVHRGRSLLGAWHATDLMVPEPRGVVAALTPWNDPVAVAAGLIGAAVVTGNTVVHKPSERCPATGRRFSEIVASCLPDGVLETVDGDATAGDRLTGSPDVDVVAHVGSSASGRMIARACAERGAKVLLENGGNDALIVDEGVPPAWAAQQTATGAFANAGQICVAVERVYVVASLADEFLSALVTEAREWADRIGPLVDERHREHVHSHVTDAESNGAHVLVGGAPRPGHGTFYPPTVLAGCTPDMLVFRDETFGPVAAVRVVPDFASALAEAADDRFGLAATVLTLDMSRAQEAVRALPVGTVKINDVFGGAPGGSAQPRRASGHGFGYGPELLDEMTTMKVVHWSPPPQ
ncbi:aldehyde dehydrogenase family protein [Mycolicibacterium sp. BiH015]|uniref:aldehyde dehydrogenase family protein n=1 Tax=Mycolicibacterium sp. BiH015 TaxID=3018808 RepID=UPI0022E061AC|nr:aldehyde dehydrogenase family protein [Mycolicibacterium sp. BiH015]MDA2892297.1 aldehyde dehydrogenase family protein [Mycolicibacterium sp. BiH015]